MRDVKAVIVLGIALDEEAIRDAPDERYNRLVRLHFEKLRRIAAEIASWLRSMGYKACPCHDQGGVEHKRAAELAGLGRVGDHTLLITPKYGCRVHLNSVLTDAPLKFDQMLDEICDHCGECIRRCPAGAIRPGRTVDSVLCGTYRREKLKRSYCGICMKVCWDHLRGSSSPD
jgi:epoxyqueuosine reductase QueG